jgi:hypothetical protein
MTFSTATYQERTPPRIREAVGVFENEESLDAAVSELEKTAFPRQDISVLGNSDSVRRTFGSAEIETARVEDDPESPRGVPVHPEEKAIGAGVVISGLAYVGGCIAAISANSMPDIALLYAIAAGSLMGGIIGAVIVLIMRSRYRYNVDRRIRKGGLVVWVRTPEPTLEKAACAILEKHGAHDVHIHDIR